VDDFIADIVVVAPHKAAEPALDPVAVLRLLTRLELMLTSLVI
jgi:hypothetical protein